MTNVETNRYNAFKRVQKFNTDNATVLATITGYTDEEKDLNDTVLLLEAAMGIQAVDNTGLAVSKSGLKTTMANTVVALALRATVIATRVGNTELAKDLNHPLTYFLKVDDESAVLRCSAAINLINTNLSVFTNITAADIATAQKAITNFSTAKDTPTSAKETKKAQGTDQIEILLDKADVYVENMGKLIQSYFPASALLNEFELQSQIINSGIRHNIVTFNITDAATQQAIVNATAICNKNQKQAETDATDPAVIEGIPVGKQEFTISAAGYVTQNITVTVARSVNTQVTVQLSK